MKRLVRLGRCRGRAHACGSRARGRHDVRGPVAVVAEPGCSEARSARAGTATTSGNGSGHDKAVTFIDNVTYRGTRRSNTSVATCTYWFVSCVKRGHCRANSAYFWGSCWSSTEGRGMVGLRMTRRRQTIVASISAIATAILASSDRRPVPARTIRRHSTAGSQRRDRSCRGHRSRRRPARSRCFVQATDTGPVLPLGRAFGVVATSGRVAATPSTTLWEAARSRQASPTKVGPRSRRCGTRDSSGSFRGTSLPSKCS